MDTKVSEEVLGRLTDVAMPKLDPSPGYEARVNLGERSLPRITCGTLVIGSGAAGLRVAVEAARRGSDVAIISQSAWGGTSACSGSDKQTLHTANTADRGDDYKNMARAIRAGGSMDEDTAYVEAVGSGRAMATLQFMGLPLPQDELGGTLRYQTDHDEVGRATSCGPRTSRLMVKVLAEEALRLKVPFYNRMTAVRILTDGEGEKRRAKGVLAILSDAADDANPLGLILIECQSLVLAAGGPGELYRDSVYPNGCFGSLGLALEAGVECVNLTESQFGIGTRREGFPWNLSGTYVQVIPHIYSVDEDGTEHHFLGDYYRTTQEMASNIFRKGYQWPFHASRMLDFKSSLVDLAIFLENRRGRRVFMDFNRNPLPVPGDQPFSLDRLDDDVRSYLENAGALQTQPIDRLKHMNPLAIELYRRYKVDVATDPLEFAVNNQHMNGGVAVDTWGRTNLPGVYAVGEAAGTHGATRPGGAALNAGQVFGTRVAEHIAASEAAGVDAGKLDQAGIAQAVGEVEGLVSDAGEFSIDDIRDEVQARMSDDAGFLCTPADVTAALDAAGKLNAGIRAGGIQIKRASEARRALQWHHMAIASEAVLTALDHYIQVGGGSRGARAICDPAGEAVPAIREGVVEEFRFRAERDKDGEAQIFVAIESGDFTIATRPNRPFDESAKNFFERDWPAWLMGDIYDVQG